MKRSDVKTVACSRPQLYNYVAKQKSAGAMTAAQPFSLLASIVFFSGTELGSEQIETANEAVQLCFDDELRILHALA